MPLHSIAVVARQARPYVDLALAALDRFGVPATARRRVSWSEVPVIRAVRSLLAAAAEGWTRHGLAELAEQPYFTSDLDVRLVNYAGYRRRLEGLGAWRRALDGIAGEAEAYEARDPAEETDERRAPLPPAARARDAATRFAAFAERAAALDPPRPLRQWLAWLRDFLAADPWDMERRLWRIPSTRYDIARLDLAGWRGLTTLVDRWCDTLDHWGGSEDRLTPEAFYRQFLDLLDGDVAIWTPVQRGVQVLEGFAAAYRSFDHVFLVGLEAGRFPLPRPASPILDDLERDALAAAGLPLESRAVWDARERELFRVLVAGARRSLTVCSSQLDTGGRDVVRSAFVEALEDVTAVAGEEIPCSRVIAQGARLASAEGWARAAGLARIEWGRGRDALSPWAGRIESPELRAHVAELLGESRLWSPTQLESYAKCPWSYFSGRLLRLARLEDPDEEMDAATRGALLHDALSRFFGHAAECLGSPVLLRASHAAMAIPLAERSLDEAFADARGRKWLGSELLLGPKRLELWRILRRLPRVGDRAERADVPHRRRQPAEARPHRRPVATRWRWARSSSSGATSASGSGASWTGSRSGSTTGSTAACSWPRWTTRPRSIPAPAAGRARPGTTAWCSRCRSTPTRLPAKLPGTHAVRVEYRALKTPEAGPLARAVQVRQGLAPRGAGRGGRRQARDRARRRRRPRPHRALGRVPGAPRRVVRLPVVLPRARDLPGARRPQGLELVVDTPTPSQLAAILATDDHVLVAAGAGTGKTSTVVQRILYLLGVPVEGHRIAQPLTLGDISAITYTNAAAADLKRQLRDELRKAGRRAEAYELDNARIGTIHAFCGAILREFALRAGRNPGARVLEEGEASALAAEAVHEALLGALEQRSVPDLDELFARYEVKKVKEWARLLVADADRLDRFAARRDELDPLARALVDFAVIARARVDRDLNDAGALDFDRMIVWTRDLLGRDRCRPPRPPAADPRAHRGRVPGRGPRPAGDRLPARRARGSAAGHHPPHAGGRPEAEHLPLPPRRRHRVARRAGRLRAAHAGTRGDAGGELPLGARDRGLRGRVGRRRARPGGRGLGCESALRGVSPAAPRHPAGQPRGPAPRRAARRSPASARPRSRGAARSRRAPSPAACAS